MNEIIKISMEKEEISKAYEIENYVLSLPQIKISTHHTLHGGMYTRTFLIPAGVLVTGALIKIPTILIISGEMLLYGLNEPRHLVGYHVLYGQANRKQVGYAIKDTFASMIFPTKANTVKEAEEEFTDEAEFLFSRNENAINFIERG